MTYVFHNLSDEKLNELAVAVSEEQHKRFIDALVHKYPQLPSIRIGRTTVDGIKAYRAAYGLGLYEARTLFNFYHRN